MVEAGCRIAKVPAPHLDEPITLFALYPSVSDISLATLGPYPVDVALDEVPAGGRWPVAVISHGLLYPEVSSFLARHLHASSAPPRCDAAR